MSALDQEALTVDLLLTGLSGDGAPLDAPFAGPVTEHEKNAKVKTALEQARGNKAAAIWLLGITCTGLYKKIHRFRL